MIKHNKPADYLSFICLAFMLFVFSGCYKTYQIANNPENNNARKKLETMSNWKIGTLRTDSSTFKVRKVRFVNDSLNVYLNQKREWEIIPISNLKDVRYIDKKAGAKDGLLIGSAIMVGISTLIVFDAFRSPEIGNDDFKEQIGVSLLGGGILALITSPFSMTMGASKGRTIIFKP